MILGSAKGGVTLPNKNNLSVAFGGAAAASIYPNGLGSSADGSITAITLNESENKLGTGCYEFNGTSSKVEVSATIPTANNYSLSVWAYMDTGIASGDTVWWLNSTGSINLPMYYAAAQDSFKLEWSGEGTGNIVGSAVTGEAWHHICVVNDSGTFSLYIDGSSVGTGTTETANSANSFSIGNLGGGNFWSGLIDDLAIWQSSLSSSNVTALWNSGDGALANTVNPTDITCYYNFDSVADDKLVNQAIP